MVLFCRANCSYLLLSWCAEESDEEDDDEDDEDFGARVAKRAKGAPCTLAAHAPVCKSHCTQH